eukprot:CAMPEP_0183304786 /NCGR_PEP_ID=MMETSP0160_2-20130417/9755_1 /TAXON_ID=2839 ORGANISM="Odontella Sinensis, Strain Grunow 1884" /NCGR_SAMPLE_ID=MMETSP0160_2 /ASSEMBLY_ACC=CAM_ASM_000250 /LENGTH=378 /DNA_ID=CAMNT_0025467899 /DNA_START=46 /DNA_END=1182 /DNA_ORIENTATION=+
MATMPIVGEAHEGEPYLSEKQTIKWVVHDFESLEHGFGQELECSPLRCHGHLWRLRLYPRGGENALESWVSAYLSLEEIDKKNNRDELKVKFSIRVGEKEEHYEPEPLPEMEMSGGNIIQRPELIDPSNNHIVNGNLTVQITIQIYMDRPSPWTPKKRLNKDMLNLLESGDQSDVTFIADEEKFLVHKLILSTRAPVLAELVENGSANNEIRIKDVDKTVFRALLRYVYAEEVPPPRKFKKLAKQLLEAADRFGCVGLKLHAEVELVNAGIDSSEAANVLLDADARSCALLKEEALSVIAANPNAAMSSPSWAGLVKSASLMDEVMKVIFAKTHCADETDYDNMDVKTLRHRLDEADMSVDGTRDMLVKRLKTTHGGK